MNELVADNLQWIVTICIGLITLYNLLRKPAQDQSKVDEMQTIDIEKLKTNQENMQTAIKKLEQSSDQLETKIRNDLEKIEKKVTHMEVTIRSEIRDLTKSILDALKSN